MAQMNLKEYTMLDATIHSLGLKMIIFGGFGTLLTIVLLMLILTAPFKFKSWSWVKPPLVCLLVFVVLSSIKYIVAGIELLSYQS